MRRAFREAISGAPGPVHLDLAGIAGEVIGDAEADLELIIEEQYANERSLQLELRKLKAELADAERDVETRILDLLDEALSSFTDADIDPASIVLTSDVPATDALGTTLAPLTPVQ